MNIKSLEVNLLKASEITEGDVIIVKIDEKEKSKLSKEDVQQIYRDVTGMIKKSVPIYFFPKNLSVDIIKKHVSMIENNKEKIEK